MVIVNAVLGADVVMLTTTLMQLKFKIRLAAVVRYRCLVDLSSTKELEGM